LELNLKYPKRLHPFRPLIEETHVEIYSPLRVIRINGIEVNTVLNPLWYGPIICNHHEIESIQNMQLSVCLSDDILLMGLVQCDCN